MSGVLITIATVFIAGLTAALTVPLVTRLAVRWNFLDHPDGERHRHETPVPRLGGVAVFAGLLVAVSVSSFLSPNFSEVTPWALPLNRALVGASAILFVIGLLDDLLGVSPAMKLFAQASAALLVISYGFVIETIAFVPGHELRLGIFAIPVTVLWLVGVSNAYNLVDGVDGLAGGVGVIALIAFALSSVALNGAHTPLQSLALAGALLGFLRFNWAPARIFLGDSGSLVVGFLLAFLAIRGSTTVGNVVYALVPIFGLSYLLLDTGIAMLRRWLRGAPLSRADGRHIHHQLLALGLSPRKAVTVIYVKSAFLALLGLCVTFVPPQMTLAITAIGVVVLLIIFMYGIRWLEYHEFLEASASFASGMRKARGAIQDRIYARDLARTLYVAKSLAEVNEIVRNSATVFRFVHMEVLHEDAPAAGTVRAPDHIGQATWLLEYPIAITSGTPRGNAADPVLAIWCAVNGGGGRPVNAERVAQILAPAIGIVLRRIGDPSRTEEETVEARLRSRPFGAHSASRRRITGEPRRAAPESAPPM